MHPAAALDREPEAGAVLCRRGLEIEQHRPVQQFDMDPAVLNGLDRIGEFDQVAGGGFLGTVGTDGGEFRDGLGSRRRFTVNSILEHSGSRQLSTSASNRSFGYCAK
jgi:hypothetical protein